MKEITLREKPIEVLKVNLGDKSFSIPLANYLPFEDLMTIKRATAETKAQVMEDVLLKKHIPADIYKVLTSADITEIMQAWTELTKEDSGASLGES